MIAPVHLFFIQIVLKQILNSLYIEKFLYFCRKF